MTAGFHVEPEVLHEAASNLLDAVRGVDGSGVEGLPAGPAVYGHDALSEAFEEFCSAVKIGVDVLVGTAESTSESLGEAAQTYVDSDESARGQLTGIVDDLQARAGRH